MSEAFKQQDNVAGRIPQDFIDELTQRADIVDLVGRRVQLKKAGREYKACCPFHDEKTPSFTVSPDKGFYHCFGCGAHGTALGFLMEFDRLEFVDAVEELAQSLGLDVPRDERGERRAPVAPVFDVLGEAARHYRQALKEFPAAVEYLRQRGLDGETARHFGIGYAPPGWDWLLGRFPDTEEARRQLLAAGLITARDNGGHYDRFRDRIVFPIRDGRGRVVGFGGRILGDGEPKYLNSPETAVFHKGRELYGLYELRQAHRAPETVLVVEGYMDVAGLVRHGVTNAVATLGTATTPEHLRRLFRATQKIVFCFDGDRAGRDAAWRALNTCLPELRSGRQVDFLFLPDGEDPDSLVRKDGAEGWQQRLDGSMSLSDYLLGELRTDADLASLDGRARLAEKAGPLLEKMPAGVYRELLLERLAQEVGLGRQRLEALLDAGERPGADRGPPQPLQLRRSGIRRSLVRRAIQLLLNYPQAGARLAAGDELPDIARSGQRGVPLLLELLEIAAGAPDISPAGLLERFRDRAEGPHLQALLAEEEPLDAAAAARELADSLQRLALAAERQRLEELSRKAAESSLSQAEKEEMRLLRRDEAGQAGDRGSGTNM